MILNSQIKPHKSIENSTNRFLKGKDGRYVPLDYIKATGNKTSRNVIKAIELADSYQIYDTNDRKNPKLIYQSKKTDKFNFRDPKPK